ncbi:MAG TPA: VanZ family protein [Ignavibacteriaceae bacterium]|nr:VanZ family protein [Ignavibacteriaceae bacterium]
MLYLVKKNKLYLLAVFGILAYCTLFSIFIVLLFDPSEKILSIDKLAHFGVFSLLTYFIFFTFSYQEKIWFIKKHRTGLTVIVASLIGIGIEVYQLYTPTRSFNVNDMIANLSGALFTVLLIKYLPKKIKKLRKYSV